MKKTFSSVTLYPQYIYTVFLSYSAWQEMLNHATMKVMEAESSKTASEAEHAKRAAFFTKAEQEEADTGKI